VSRSHPVLSRVPDPQRTVTLHFAPSALTAADGLLYAGSEDGSLVAFDAVSGALEPVTRVRGEVKYIVAHGDHVFAAGDETITRFDTNLEEPVARRIGDKREDAALSAFAGGSLGLWGLTDKGATLRHFSSQSLATVQRFPLPGPATGLAVTEKGVWTTPVTGRDVLLLHRLHGAWRQQQVRLPCHPTRTVAEHDRVFLLCPSASLVVVASDLSVRILTLYSVGAESTDLAIANGSLWVLSRSLDHFSQFALGQHRLVGKPVGVGNESNGLAADQHAVWVSEANDSVTRSDVRLLGRSRGHAKAAQALSTWLGIDPTLVYAVDFVGGVLLTILLTLLWQLKINSPFPTYFPPLHVVAYCTTGLFDALAGARIEEQTHEGVVGASGKGGGFLSIGRSRQRRRGRDSLDKHVCRNIWSWHGRGLLYMGANFVPGANHRGIRTTAADPPTDGDLRGHWRLIGDRGFLCLITEGCWLVSQVASDLVFKLDYVFDRLAGKVEEVPRPSGTEIVFQVPKALMTSSGELRCRPGQRVRLDVIGKALPIDDAGRIAIEPVVAWEPVSPARELAQLRDYVFARVSQPASAE
jgi:hypothetical protein